MISIVFINKMIKEIFRENKKKKFFFFFSLTIITKKINILLYLINKERKIESFFYF